MDKLCSYSWPGNIRELRHTIEKAVILCEDHFLKPEDLHLYSDGLVKITRDTSSKLTDVERNAISQVLNDCRGNFSKAAKILDISRTTLYAKIKKYGLQ